MVSSLHTWSVDDLSKVKLRDLAEVRSRNSPEIRKLRDMTHTSMGKIVNVLLGLHEVINLKKIRVQLEDGPLTSFVSVETMLVKNCLCCS